MPPKPAQKGRSAKSSKLSKAEKEKLKKEEAERKAKEEEEARLKEEQEKREQEERERLEREERQKLWEAEKARHQAEVDEVNEILDNNSLQLKSLEEAQRSKAKWERYMLCDGSPDPLIENELNTFIHPWRDDAIPASTKHVLEECENTLKLISELEWHVKSSEQEQPSEQELTRYKESVKKLQDLIGFKLDRATMELLLTALDNVDPESQNLEYITSTKHITLCLWGNTAKNPRLKSVSFDKQGFTIEVPKSLAVGEISIRVLLTAYDHLSPLAKSFYPKQKKLPEVVVEVVQEPEEDKKEEGEEDQKPSEEDQNNTITPKSASVVSRGSKTSKAKSGRTGSSKSNRSRKASAKSAKSQSSEQTNQKEPEPEQELADDAATKTEQSIDEGPPEIANVDELEGDDDDDDDDDDVVDLRAFGVVGPIIFLELLELPPQPKHVKTWTIQQIVSPDLKRLPYQNQSIVPGSASSTGPQPSSASNTHVQATNQPLVINMKLPGNVMYFEQPQLAWWEPVKSQWRMDGLTDVTYNDEERSMSFKTAGFGPIATTQDLYLNMPFQSWEIRPHKTNSCVFTLIAAIIEMEIEIQDGLCCLGQPDDIEELSHLVGKWMKPKDLMESLKAAGVNVFPAEDADKYVSINKKDDRLEKEMYQEMSLTASAFAYSWSKWNAESGEDRIVLQTTEQLQDEMLLEEDWSLYLLTTKSSCKLKMKEDDTEFSDHAADNTQLHSNLYHMLKDGASQEAQQRIQESSFLFVDCVYQLLSATKVVTYS